MELSNSFLQADKGLQFDRLVEQAPVAIAILTGPEFRIQTANKKLLHYWARTREEVIGKALFDVFPERTPSGSREILADVLFTGIAFNGSEMPADLICGGMQKMGWFDITCEPIRNEEEVVDSVMVMVVDVTEQVLSRRQLQESQRDLYYTFELNPEVTWKADADGSIISINERWQALTGREQELALLEGWAAVTHPQDLEGLAAAWKEALSSGNGLDVEHRVRHHDETYRWMRSRAFSRKKEDGQVFLWYGATTNIEGRKQAELIARRKEREYHDLLERMDQGFCIFEMIFDGDNKPIDYRFLETNTVFEQQTGLVSPVGKTARELVPGLEDHWFRIYGNVALTGQSVQFIEGSEAMGRWFEVAAYRFGGETSRKVALLFTDITDRKRQEEKLKESEKRYHDIYNGVPVSIWEQDYSRVRRQILDLKASGIHDLRTYFKTYRASLLDCASKIAIRDVNEATLELYGGTKDELLAGLASFFTDESLTTFIEQAVVIAAGGGRFERESLVVNRNGEPLNVLIRVDFPRTEDYSHIHVLMFNITERKRAEAALQESEKRFRHLADNSPVMIWVTDEEGYCHYLNQRWLDFTGQTLEEGSGIGWADAVHPAERESAATDFLDASSRRVPYSKEYRLRRKDGAYEWMIDSAVPRYDEGGNFLGYIGSVVNIHQRKMAEDELRKLSYHLQLSTISAGVGTWSYDLAAGTLDWSDLHKEMWGYRKSQDLNYEDWSRVILPEDRHKAMEIVEEARQKNTEYQNEYRIRRVNDGAIRWMRSFGKFIPGPDGKPAVLTGISVDITDRMQALEALKESEHRFRNLSDHAPMWVWLSDEKANVTYMNREELDFFGLEKAGGATTKIWEQFIHPDDLSHVYEVYNKAITSRSAYSLEVRVFNSATGNYEWFHFRGVPRTEQGVFKGVIGTAINIHHQRMLKNELEQLVKDRTSELQRSNEDLQQFAHVASHDLKEPVRKIKLFANYLENEMGPEFNEQGRRFLSKIQTSAARMVSMIDGVLNYAKLGVGRELVEPVDLAGILDAIQVDLELPIGETGTVVEYKALPVIMGLRVSLYQLFYNLVLNAIKFSRAGVAPQIRISAASQMEEGRACWRIEVEDNGIGFQQQYAERIFKPFVRLHSKDEIEGSGLGLALCQKIVERHGGRIQAQGREGAGSTFTIWFPVAAEFE